MHEASRADARIDGIEARAYTVPTEEPESDGTITWDSHTMIAVHARGGGETGFGYAYSHRAAAVLINEKFADHVAGRDAFDPRGAWMAMRAALRNLGQPGLGASALSAIDNALWDLKAKLLGVPLARLLGQVRDDVMAYGSGGFTSYNDQRLQDQLGHWADEGFSAVKMKVGRDPTRDTHRVRIAREAIGPDVDLYVDANGAYTAKQALLHADAFADQGVRWFEEPVSSDDLEGLRFVRDHGPAGVSVAAGEYGWRMNDFRRMLEARAVDVLQADVTRCGGATAFMMVDALCDAFDVPLSAHTAPSLHTPLCCTAVRAVHVEYFHDHVRQEALLLDGAMRAEGGRLRPALSEPGWGLVLKTADAERYRV